MRCLVHPWCAALLVAVCIAQPALAQASSLDRGRLIEGLSDRGLSELLMHYIEAEPPSDPADRLLLTVAQHQLAADALRGRAASLATDDPAAAEDLTRQSHERYEQMLEAQRELAESPQLQQRRERAVWLTDLAEMLLFGELRGRYSSAAEFYEFGVPTTEQREAFEQIVPEALSAALRAQALIDDLAGQYARSPAMRQQDEQSLLYYRLIDDYGSQRTPLYAAYSAYYASLLPQSHPYYQTLGPNNPANVPGQRTSAADERARLLQGAFERLDRFAREQAGEAANAARSLAGRTLTRLSQPQEAVQRWLDPLISENVESISGLTAMLGKADALAAMQRVPASLEVLQQASGSPQASDNPLYRLLVADAAFRVLERQASATDAARQEDALARAYNVYFELFNEPALGAQREAIRRYVYQRWAGNLAVGSDVADLPPVVRMAIGEVARTRGQNELAAGDEGAADTLRWAIEVNRTVTGEGLPDAVRASGLFNQALSQALLNQGDVATLIGSVTLWTRLASELQAQPLAEEAIRYAADFARLLRDQASQDPRVQQLYRDTMAVLFEKYPSTDTAAEHRLYYGYSEYQSAGQYGRAAEVYDRVPRDHRDYFEAQGLRVYCLITEYNAKASFPAEQDELRPAAAAAAQRLAGEAAAAFAAATDQTLRHAAGNALGNARLALSDLALSTGDTDQALEHLESFDRDFADDPAFAGPMARALEKRILIFVSNQQYDRATAEAQAMMERYPDAAAAVIGHVLDGLQSRIATLRDQMIGATTVVINEKEQQASDLASVSGSLAKLLLDWAQQQGFDAPTLLAYQLPYIKSLRIAGQSAQAAEALNEMGLLDAFGNDLDVLLEAGETYYALGVREARTLSGTVYEAVDQGAMDRAAGYFDTLIQGLSEPYPPAYWVAWIRRLSINLASRQNVEDVLLRVGQLAQIDPTFGSPDGKFKQQFDALAAAANALRTQ